MKGMGMTHIPRGDGVAAVAISAPPLTLAHAHPAHVSSLPAILRDVAPPEQAQGECSQPEQSFDAVTPLAIWCASIGRTAADVAALLFKMPAPEVVRELFEDEIRQTVTVELLARKMDDAERQHMEDIAWIAFDRRMDRHGWNGARKGTA